MIIPIILLVLVSLCWGSFLNVVAYRLIKGESLGGRSRCIHCKHSIAWYDTLPIISYLVLQGRCRTCHQPISLLYPGIELLTALSMTLLYYIREPDYFFAYFLFFSALIITIRTDLETMLISRYTTLLLIPVGALFSWVDYMPLIPLDSIMGAAIGYVSLWLISALFYACTGKQGIGEGDFELLAFIGSFTGIFGVWASLMIGSITGSIIGITYLYASGTLQRHAKIPFGPFLALGALIYVLWEDYIALMLTGF